MTADILTRLRKATGADRELDAEIAVFARWHPYGPEHWLNRSPEAAFSILSAGRVNFSLPDETEPRGGWVVPSFTDSIDASLALVERMLPGWGGLIGIGTGTSIHTADLWSEARAHQNSEEEEENPLVGEDAHGEHRCLPIAVLIALFTALQEKENTNADA
ncbi:hypothetical protein ASD54_12560 [Rhizobium sp. Root149]|uniref:hypothetical protein n=1 Tax=Rhizobium sp. Root149 TaxID=1736473 RepID=UPI0007151464|nr:hypothetical protein [Rhizobium sp. Root149]KQZ49762.1 hypothetical protein ASD54_12560 [Rhizobium sp. Root149]